MVGVISSLAAFFFFINLHAQQEKYQNLDQFLFPEFSASRLKMKDGKNATLVLNFNTITQNMVLLTNGQLYDMTNQELVDTVFLQNRKFIPFGKIFYELVADANVPFFIQHKSDLKDTGTPSGYGGTSQTAATTMVSGFEHTSNYYNLKLPPKYEVIPSTVFWVRVNGNYFSFITERQLLKIFPDQADQIKQFIKASKLKIATREDLIKLGNFCNQLMK